MVVALLVCCCVLAAKRSHADAEASQVEAVFRAITPCLVVVDCVIEVRDAATTKRFPLKSQGLLVSASGRVMLLASVFSRVPISSALAAGAAMPSDFRVTLSSGEQFGATVIGRDEDINLAFLQIASGTRRRFPYVKFVNRELKLGEKVVAFGLLPKRYDYRPQFQSGRVNAIINKLIRFYTTDRPLTSCMGGPVATLDGAVVGIVSNDVITSQSLSGGLGPALRSLVLPSSAFARLIERPPRKVAKKGWLGIEMQALDRDVARALGLGNTTGIIVSRVFRGLGFPAEKAGLQAEDIITEFNGRKVPVAHSGEEYMFRRMVRAAGPRAHVPLRVLRHGKPLDLVIDLAQTPKTSREAKHYRDQEFGVVVSDITLDMALALNLFSLGVDIEGALVNAVDPAGWAGLGGLRANDIILAVDEHPVKTIDDFKRLLARSRKAKKKELVLFVRRGGETTFVRIEPDWK